MELDMDRKDVSRAPEGGRILRRTISAPSVKGNLSSDKDSAFYNPSSTSSSFSSSPSSCSKSYISKTSPETIVPRTRVYSAGSQVTPITLNVDCNSISPSSSVGLGSPAPRVLQIRREESVDELTREVAKERDIQSAIQLSRSWDEISWLGDKNFVSINDRRDKSLEELPSPVRFIEKFHMRSSTPSPISVPISPKQRTYRRSLSPSCLKPSLLSSKRKLDPDDDVCTGSPAKRMNGGSDVMMEESLLTCDTRPMMGKPRYVAPQSPLATTEQRNNTGYTFHAVPKD